MKVGGEFSQLGDFLFQKMKKEQGKFVILGDFNTSFRN
jgi:predicted extracellular nuclease